MARNRCFVRKYFAYKRFADKAGFTQHCWECVHSADWDALTGRCGRCTVYGIDVDKYDSPNNCSTYLGKICDSYRTEVDE